MKKTLVFLALTAVCGLVSAQTLNASLDADVRGLMPGGSPDTSSGTVRQNIYEGLVASKEDGTVAPMLAKSVSVSKDGTEYTFALRSGVSFHNGDALTAKQVLWTWHQFLDPKSAWPCRNSFDGSNGIKIDAISAPDPMTVVFKLASPSPMFLPAMARLDCDSSGIADPASVDAKGDWVSAIGTGPFMLDTWKRGESIDLIKFKGYQSRTEASDGLTGEKRALVDRVHMRIIRDPATATAAMESGATDLWLDVPPTALGELKSQPNVKLQTNQLASILAISLQTEDPVLKDKRVRQALSMAIDRAGMVQAIMGGTSVATASLVPPTSRFFGSVEKTMPKYDLMAAKALLTQGGYHGQPVTILTTSSNQTMSQAAVTAQAMLQSIGVNAQIEVVEFGTLYQRYYAGKYQLAMWNVTPYLDPTFIFGRFIGDKAAQPDKPWSNPDARALYAKLLAATTDSERQTLIDSLNKAFMDQVPMIIWSSRSLVTAVGPRVKGYTPWAGQKARYWNISVAAK